jgi:hypothetical protein
VANNLHRSDDETYSNTHRYPLHSDPDVVLIPPLRTDRRVCNRWVTDFHGALTVPVLMEYIELDQVVLQPDIPDEQTWRLSPTGQFSTKSAYVAMFQGAIPFEPTERVWKTWAPSKCKFFIWLVEHNRCWTADKFEKRGLDHPKQCPLCDQQLETINHLLVSCIFARQI